MSSVNNTITGEATAEKKGVKRAAPDETPSQGSNVVENNADAPPPPSSSSSSPSPPSSSAVVVESSLPHPSPPPPSPPSRATKIVKPNPPDEDEQTQPVTAVVDPVEAKETSSPAEPGANASDITTMNTTTTTTTTMMSDSERVEAEALSDVGLSLGDRLEVMWILEEDEKTTEKWWGCTVAGAVPGERDESGLPVFSLHYDAFQAFEEADHDVTFTDAFRLTHLEDGAEMTWKKEGQEVDKDAVMASLANEDVDLQEVVAAQAEEDAAAGEESTESRGMKELAQLPFHQQSALAEGFRRMTDVVKGHLRAKMEQQGGGEVVVSAADVENMFREVRAGEGASGRY